MDKDNKIILYKDADGRVSVNVRFADEDVWLTQDQLADLYNTTQQNISLHQNGIYADGEVDEEATHKKYLLIRQEGNRPVQRQIDHYNLDMVIALGYRVQILQPQKNILVGNGWFPVKKPSRKQKRSLKLTANAKCGCWKAISTRP